MPIKLGRRRMRPARIHFKVAAEGFRSLITLTYFSGDPYLDTDSVFSVRPQLVLDLRKHDSPAEIRAARLSASFDFVLDRLNLGVGKDRVPVHEFAMR
jgi:protocatechuate 3,4-dioxygenase beta subunit